MTPDLSPEEALATVLKVRDAAHVLERDEGFPGMFEQGSSGELAALRALGYELRPIGGLDRKKWTQLLEEEQASRAAALDVGRLGLSAEQTTLLREHLTSRQQTVSEFLGDMLMDIGLGRASEKDYPPPARLAAEEGAE